MCTESIACWYNWSLIHRQAIQLTTQKDPFGAIQQPNLGLVSPSSQFRNALEKHILKNTLSKNVAQYNNTILARSVLPLNLKIHLRNTFQKYTFKKCGAIQQPNLGLVSPSSQFTNALKKYILKNTLSKMWRDTTTQSWFGHSFPLNLEVHSRNAFWTYI